MKLIPFGVDTNSEHIKDARQLFPGLEDHFYTSDRFLQTSIKKRPKKLQGPFDYVFWNVWDNLPVSFFDNVHFKAYFTYLLSSESFHTLGIHNAKVINNPQGIEKAMVIEKIS